MRSEYSAPPTRLAYSGRWNAVRKLLHLVGVCGTARFLWARAWHHPEVELILKLTQSKITLRDIVEQRGPIDLLKLDIEGAEWPLFESDRSWMEEVGVIVVELHGPNKEHRLIEALRDHDVMIHVQHEKHIVVKSTVNPDGLQDSVESGKGKDN